MFKASDDEIVAVILSGLIAGNEVSTRREGEVEAAILKAREIASKILDK